MQDVHFDARGSGFGAGAGLDVGLSGSGPCSSFGVGVVVSAVHACDSGQSRCRFLRLNAEGRKKVRKYVVRIAILKEREGEANGISFSRYVWILLNL